MRSKEDANDYRYFPDPDLLPLEISASWIEQVKSALPELPQARRERYVAEFGLSAYDAAVLTASRETADYFEAAAKQLPAQAKLCANWIMGDINGQLNKEGIDISACPVNPSQLAALLTRIGDGTISGKAAKTVFESMWNGELDKNADAIIAAKGLKQISDDSAIEKIVDQVLAANAQQVADYRAGKEKAFNSLVGQIMKATQGKANPAQVNAMLKKKLDG
jgi:aspartyl-tRNA(Asn)/glutamyl-tRNA(Gln) amidotransferase subunit B